MKQLDFTVRSNDKLNDQNHLLKVVPSDNEQLPEMLPGQFVQILVENAQHTFLRRPISINNIVPERNEIWLLVQTVGEGTQSYVRWLSGGDSTCWFRWETASPSHPVAEATCWWVAVWDGSLLFLRKEAA